MIVGVAPLPAWVGSRPFCAACKAEAWRSARAQRIARRRGAIAAAPLLPSIHLLLLLLLLHLLLLLPGGAAAALARCPAL